MTIQAKGILYHHFWGEYYNEVYLTFESEWQAQQAIKQLKHKDWKQQLNQVGICTKDDLKAELEHFGADTDKAYSLAKSVDRGEPFTCTFNIEHPDQTLLKI